MKRKDCRCSWCSGGWWRLKKSREKAWKQEPAGYPISIKSTARSLKWTRSAWGAPTEKSRLRNQQPPRRQPFSFNKKKRIFFFSTNWASFWLNKSTNSDWPINFYIVKNGCPDIVWMIEKIILKRSGSPKKGPFSKKCIWTKSNVFFWPEKNGAPSWCRTLYIQMGRIIHKNMARLPALFSLLSVQSNELRLVLAAQSKHCPVVEVSGYDNKSKTKRIRVLSATDWIIDWFKI